MCMPGGFPGIEKVIDYWQGNYQPLRQASERFSRAFYGYYAGA